MYNIDDVVSRSGTLPGRTGVSDRKSYVILNYYEPNSETTRFHTLSGEAALVTITDIVARLQEDNS